MENIKEKIIDRCVVAVENKIYDKIVFTGHCVVSGSLVANEVQANGNLVIFGDCAVKYFLKVHGDLTVTGKLLGGEDREKEMRLTGGFQYCGLIEITGNLIAGEIKTKASLFAKNITSRNVITPERIRAKNIFTPGVLKLYSGDSTKRINVENKISASSIQMDMQNSCIEAKSIECLGCLTASYIKAQEIKTKHISKEFGESPKIDCTNITLVD